MSIKVCGLQRRIVFEQIKRNDAFFFKIKKNCITVLGIG